LRRKFPDEYDSCGEAHRHKNFLIDPRELKSFFPDLKIFKAVQVPGSYIIAGPGTFHEGFNEGLNLAVAVNFGTAQWKASWQKKKVCLCRPGWNVKTLLKRQFERMTSRWETETQIEKRCQLASKGYSEKIISMTVSSKHFAKWKSCTFIMVVNAREYDYVTRKMKRIARHTKPGSHILVPDLSSSSGFCEGYIWRLYKLKCKKSLSFAKIACPEKDADAYDSDFDIEELQLGEETEEKRLQNLQCEEEAEAEEPSVNKRRVLSSQTEFTVMKGYEDFIYHNEQLGKEGDPFDLNQILQLGNNPAYKEVLQHCLILPKHVTSKQKLKTKVHRDPLVGCKLKEMNSLVLAKVCSDIPGNNLDYLSWVTQQIREEKLKLINQKNNIDFNIPTFQSPDSLNLVDSKMQDVNEEAKISEMLYFQDIAPAIHED